MGIDENTPVVVGASDGVLSNLGVNSYKKGSCSHNWDIVRFVQLLISRVQIIKVAFSVMS